MKRRGSKLLLSKLLPKRLDDKTTQKLAAALLEGTDKRTRPAYLKGVHRGRFYRIKLGKSKEEAAGSSPPHLLQLPTPGGPFPQGFKTVQQPQAALAKSTGSQDGSFSYWLFIKRWIQENWPTLVLNFGSVCTLIGFTRSDVLELRMLSVTGSMANVIYNFTLSPTRYLPVCWSALFATVNGVKIREILQERHQEVHMSPEQEDIFVRFFMPHGITPRQFQVLEETAEEVIIPKGSAIIRQGEVIDHVCLVVSGSTRASISGRRLTAASAICPKSITEEKAGGNSGAWVGEMSFLETYWQKEQKKKAKVPSKQPTPPTKTEKDVETSEEKQSKKGVEKLDGASDSSDNTMKASRSLETNTKEEVKKEKSTPNATENEPMSPPVNRYTIVAADECVIWRWKFNEVEKMMNRSTDFRAALSRAMTSAIVSKVINFTVSKTSAIPTWSTWLDDWRYNAGASVNVKTDLDIPEEDLEEEVEEDQSSNDFEEHGVI